MQNIHFNLQNRYNHLKTIEHDVEYHDILHSAFILKPYLLYWVYQNLLLYWNTLIHFKTFFRQQFKKFCVNSSCIYLVKKKLQISLLSSKKRYFKRFLYLQLNDLASCFPNYLYFTKLQWLPVLTVDAWNVS